MIIARYLSKQIAVSVALVMLALLGLFAFFDLIAELDDVGREGYRFSQAVGYVLLNTPGKIYELMPIGVLIGAIYALSQFASNSEFTAMRAAGLGRKEAIRSVAGLGLAFAVITFTVGEFLTPPLERWSKIVKGVSVDGRAAQLPSGAWIKDTLRDDQGQIQRQRFVNVRSLSPDGKLSGVRIYEFDPQFRLTRIQSAKTGSFVANGYWQLDENRIEDYSFDGQEKTVRQTPVEQWRSDLTPSLFGVLAVDPEKMSAWRLYQYLEHLEANQQKAARYEIAMWRKLVYPWVCGVMLALALPFGYLNARAGGIGYKVSAGVLLGVAFHTLNGLFSNLGVINTWPAWFSATVPSIFACLLAFFMLWWVERV